MIGPHLRRVQAQLGAAIREGHVVEPWRPMVERLERLLSSTSSSIVVYDAVPAPNWDDGILQVDTLSPHYAAYYGGKRNTPSDDENPVPTAFLTVRPGVEFEFRIACRPTSGASDG